MNDYLSVRGTRDFARVSPEELNRVQIAENGYRRKKRSAGTQIGTMISRYLCDGLDGMEDGPLVWQTGGAPAVHHLR